MRTRTPDARYTDEWRNIDGFPDWSVSSRGEVLNGATERIMAQRINQQGLTMVNLWQEGNIHTRLVALLVAKAFLDPPRNSAYNSVIHLNGDRSDCRALNLMWRPRWYAIRYHRMFEQFPVRVSVYVPALNRVYSSLRELCTTYGLVERDTYISMINNEPCFHYGWIIERR